MTREFIFTKPFLASWSAMGLDDTSLKDLEVILLKNPQIGDVIQGTGGARKMRIQLEGRGKSGSSRVIYIDFAVGEKILGLAAYAKADKDSLTKGEKNTIKKLVQGLEKIYNHPGRKEE